MGPTAQVQVRANVRVLVTVRKAMRPFRYLKMPVVPVAPASTERVQRTVSFHGKGSEGSVIWGLPVFELG